MVVASTLWARLGTGIWLWVAQLGVVTLLGTAVGQGNRVGYGPGGSGVMGSPQEGGGRQGHCAGVKGGKHQGLRSWGQGSTQ